ncbi:MAG: hypothetical protein ABIF19_14630 [Planctomycetota bacterium]
MAAQKIAMKRIISTSNWSEWVDIEKARSTNGPFNYLGIYQIRAATTSGKPISIQRLAGVDASGVLYIGRSGFNSNRSIANRIGEFVRKQHSGGITYAKAKPVLDERPRFSKHCLQVKAKFLKTDQIPKAESEALDEYFLEYAELPPCNSARVKCQK